MWPSLKLKWSLSTGNGTAIAFPMGQRVLRGDGQAKDILQRYNASDKYHEFPASVFLFAFEAPSTYYWRGLISWVCFDEGVSALKFEQASYSRP